MAVATGIAEVVVCYRAFNERSGFRFGRTDRVTPGMEYGWYAPYGLVTPASWVAMHARRYMHDFNVTSADFGVISVADRKHAATNPKAWFYERPITLEDHQESDWVVEPLHLLDCCQESDGAVAIVVTSAERAKDLQQKPVSIEAAAQGAWADQESMTSYYRDEINGLPEMGVVGRQLWEQSGLSPKDIQTAIFYDHFTPFVLVQMEELGFCKRGEAKDFIAGRRHRARRPPPDQHQRRTARRGVHPRDERDRRRRSTSERDVGESGRRSRARAVHGRDGRPDQRIDIGAQLRRLSCLKPSS